MSCENSLELVSSLLDGRLTAAKRKNALSHLETCGACHVRYWTARSQRQALRSLDTAVVPDMLAGKLRVMASHERERNLRRASIRTAVQHWAARMRLSFDNMMRPVALPFAGGLISALLLFGTIVPSLAFSYRYHSDVPIMLYTDPDGKVVDWFESGMELPRLEPVNTVLTGDANVVEVTVDPNGFISDFSLVKGQLTQAAQQLILFSRFTPATIFGRPTYGKKLVVYSVSPART